MVVILPDRELTVTVLPHPWPRDARGMPKPPTPDMGDERGPYPGAAQESPDGSWALRVDPRCWPVRAGDRITDGTYEWVATGSPKLHAVPVHPDVDFIEVTATLEPPKVP